MRLPPAVLISAAVLALAACQPSGERPATEAVTSAPASPAMPDGAPTQETAPPQVSIPEGPDMAPVRVPAGDTPCRESIGETASARLVQRCIAVSPATHPPCNAANTCEMIQGEIDRSCGMYGPDEIKPAECTA